MGEGLLARQLPARLMAERDAAAHEGALDRGVGDGVSGHVEEEEVALFGAEYALVYEALCEPFSYLFELEPDFGYIPRFALKIKNVAISGITEYVAYHDVPLNKSIQVVTDIRSPS